MPARALKLQVRHTSWLLAPHADAGSASASIRDGGQGGISSDPRNNCAVRK